MGLYKQAYTDELNGRRVTDSNYMVGTIEDPAFRRSRTGQQWIRRFGKDFDINDPHNAQKLIGTKWESIAYPRGVPQELQEQVAQRIGGSRFGRYGNSRTKGAIAVNQRADELARQRAEEQERQRQVAANTKQYQQQQQQGDKDAMQKMRDLQMSYNPNDPQWARDYKAAVDNMMMRNPDFDASKDTLYGAAVTTLGLPQTASNSGRSLNSLYNGAPQTGTGATAQPAGMSAGMTLPSTGLALSNLHPSDGVSAMPAKRPQAQQQQQQVPLQQQQQVPQQQSVQQQQQQQPQQPVKNDDRYAGYHEVEPPVGWIGGWHTWQDIADSREKRRPVGLNTAYFGAIRAEIDSRRAMDAAVPEHPLSRQEDLMYDLGMDHTPDLLFRLSEVYKRPYLQDAVQQTIQQIGQQQQQQPVQQPQQEQQQPRQAMLEKAPQYIGNKIGQVGAKIDKFPAYIGNKINSAADQIQRRFNGTPAPNPVRRTPQTVGANSTMLPGIGSGYRNKLVNQFFNPDKWQNQQKPQGPGNSNLGFKR